MSQVAPGKSSFRPTIQVSLVLWILSAFYTVLMLFPNYTWSGSTDTPLVTVEIEYVVPAAGDVLFVWGVNGWLPVPEDIRPSNTKMKDQLMLTSMVKRGQSFFVTIAVERGSKVDYGFSITKTAGGARIEVWDGDESYQFTATRSDSLRVTPQRFYQNAFVLADRSGVMLSVTLALTFIGLLLTAVGRIRSESASPEQDGQAFQPDLKFALAISLLALLAGLAVMLQHEMWRDELQAWRIATASHTLTQLLDNARYEGHPLFWYVCLYVLSRFSGDPILMQLFHLCVGVTAIFVLCRYAPLTRWQKACLSFGYFFFYEYLIISRNYALGVLALLTFCALRTYRPDRVLTCAVLLALMINANAFVAIIALTLGGWLLLESFALHDRVSITARVGIVLVLGLGLAAALMQSSPPSDHLPKMLSWNTSLLGFSLEKAVNNIWRAYVPLPSSLPHFWNTNLLDGLPSFHVGGFIVEPRDIQTLLSFGLLGLSALIFLRTPSIMLVYVIATGGLLLFMHLKVNHGIRHTGHLFLVLLACLWLSSIRRRFEATVINRRGITTAFVTLLIVIQAIVGGLAAATDLVYPFSASKDAARFIQERGLRDATMIGSTLDIASGVANYLDRPMYYAENKQRGTFIRWQDKRTHVPPAEVARTAKDLAHQNHTDVVMIVSYDLGIAGTGLQELGSFQRSILPEERYWLYLVPYYTNPSANGPTPNLDARK